MPRRKRGSLPELCHHRASGRGYVTDPRTGRELYFGPWGLDETRAAYDRWVAEYAGRRQEVASASPPRQSVPVAGLIDDYLTWAEGYYQKRGRVTSELPIITAALKPLNELYGATPAAEFGPAALKAVRQNMLDHPITTTRKRKKPDGTVEVVTIKKAAGYARATVNKLVERIRRMFKWGVEHELVPPSVLVGLSAVRGLARGRTTARESDPVLPVPPGDLERTLAVLAKDLRPVVRVQVLLACRPGEVCAMRADEIDRTTLPWVYRPSSHKTEHKGRERIIFIGPKARAILGPILDAGEEAGLPADRPVFPSRGRGVCKGYRGPLTVPGYRSGVARACRRAKVKRWSPNQLRHSGLTLVRQQGGLEAAQAIGGHAELETTQVYAERLLGLAREVVERIG